MNNLYKFFFLFYFILGLVFCAASQSDTTYLLLSSGAPGKAYFEDAKIITGILNGRFNKVRVVNVQSSGSEENFKRLADHSADFIIAQRDIACTHFYDKENAIRNFQIVMPLFPEAVQIFVRGRSGTIRFSEFKKMMQSGEVKKIAIGPPQSSCNIVVRDLFNILEVNIDENRFDQRSESVAFADFSVDSTDVDAIAFYSSPPVNFIQFKRLDSVGIVNYSSAELNPILSHFKSLEEIRFSGSMYPFLKTEDTIHGIGTWAFLFVNSDIVTNQLKNESISMPGEIIKGVLAHHKGSHLYHTYSVSEIELETDTGQGKIKVKNTRNELNSFFRGLPLDPNLQEIFDYYPDNHTFSYCVLFAIVLVAITLYLFLGRDSILINYWYRYRHWLFAFLFAFAVTFACISLIRHYERDFFETYGTQSPMLNLSWMDVLKWLLLAKLVSHDSSIFPMSLGGQIVATVSFYLYWGALGFSLIYQFVFNHRINKRKMGTQRLNLKDHYIICGWNSKTPQLIKEMFEASKNYSNGKHIHVVLITDKVDHTDILGIEKETLVLSGHLNFVKGEAREDKVMKDAAMEFAKTIVLVSEDRSVHADEKNLLRALAIARYCKEAKHADMDQSYIIAEINDQIFKNAFIDADVDEVVCSGEMVNKLVVQSTFNHGISEVVTSILTYDEDNEIYSMKLSDFPHLAGHTFDELLPILRHEGILLMGIRRYCRDEKTGNEILDSRYIATMLKDPKSNFGCEEHNIINPSSTAQKQYKTQVIDNLIVLASSEKAIMKLKRNKTLDNVFSTEFKTLRH